MARKKIRIKSRFGEGDFGVVITTLILSIVGIVAVFSASYYSALSKYGDPNYYLKNNRMWMALGWVVFIVVANIDYHIWSRIAVAARWLVLPPRMKSL